ncbi:hypothetical protein CHU98_g984 [Xylaria longipes]|nr:hypothetical protein CHU98_g984 [Xylaria longipes]
MQPELQHAGADADAVQNTTRHPAAAKGPPTLGYSEFSYHHHDNERSGPKRDSLALSNADGGVKEEIHLFKCSDTLDTLHSPENCRLFREILVQERMTARLVMRL